MGYTLAHLAKIETTPLKKGVLMNLLRYCQAMSIIPWENTDSLSSVAVRWKSLPSVAFRKINEGYTASEGDMEQIWESVYNFGGDISLDRVFEKIKNTIVDPKVSQTNMKLKAMALTFNDYFINGDHAVDEDGFEGLKKRVAGMPSRQTVYGAASNAAALDPTSSTAAAKSFLDKWEEAFYKCNGGAVSAIWGNEGIRWGFGRVLRYAQISGAAWLDSTKDSFDREVLTYKGVPLFDIGYKSDLTTEIIPDDEVAGDAGTDATSVYFTSFVSPERAEGEGGTEGGDISEGLTGIQMSDLAAYDPLNGGEQATVPAKLIRIDWQVGLANFGAHSITRLRNIEGASNWT
jgi:hypothetical protein